MAMSRVRMCFHVDSKVASSGELGSTFTSTKIVPVPILHSPLLLSSSWGAYP